MPLVRIFNMLVSTIDTLAGYGAGAPADASLYAFDPTSSSWLTAFTIAVAIPSSISSTPTSTIASSAAASDTSSTPVWSVPGQPVQSAPPEATTDASAKEEPATTVPKIAVIIGSVVGTVALVALGGAAYIISRKRKRSSYRRDLHGLPSTGSDGVTIEKANPVRQPWRRFDMLEDEEMIWSGRRAGTDEYGFDEVEVRTPVSRGYDLGVGVPMSRREGSLMGEARRVVSDSASAVAASLGIGAAPAIRYSNVGRGEEEQQPLSPEASKRNMLSPAISLYGSTFSPLPGETPAAYNPLRRSGTWWTRFTANAGLARASPSQQRIRDPTPVPGSGDDPFQDPTWASSNPHSTDTTPKRSSYARHGRGEEDSDDEDDELLHPRREEGSMNSLASATSSLLEERIRTMDVVRRERPSEGSMTDVSPSTDDGAGPFADAERTPRFADEVVWRGTEVFSPSATTAIMSPTSMYAPTPPIPQSGVRSMVAEFERRKSLSESMAMQDTAMPPTGAMSPRTKARINHGLVKKPQLYVANPS